MIRILCIYVSYNSFPSEHFIMWKRINKYYDYFLSDSSLADDCPLYHPKKSLADRWFLERYLTALQAWTDMLEMNFNPTISATKPEGIPPPQKKIDY